MIAKIKQGKGFGGLVSYANDIKNKDTNIIASEGVDLSTNKSIVASFNIQAKARPTLKAYVGHISLSFSPEDYKRMSDELIAEISRKYLQRMGIVTPNLSSSATTTRRTTVFILCTTEWIMTATQSLVTATSKNQQPSPRHSQGNTA